MTSGWSVGGAMTLANRPDAQPLLARIRLPTLVYVGVEDAVYPVSMAKSMQQVIPGSTLATIAGAAHAAVSEAPEPSLQQILDWTGSVRGWPRPSPPTHLPTAAMSRDPRRGGEPPTDPALRQQSAPAPGDVTRAHRDIQDQVDRADRSHERERQDGEPDGSDAPHGAQAGARPQPALPFPAQHLTKPGLEADLQPRPNYMAPQYRGSGKLQDMVAIVTGGDSGIGRAVAVLLAREGADVAIVYLPVEQPDAEETRDAVEGEGRRCLLVPGDVTDYEFCRHVVERTVRELGRLDVLVNNAAFQEHAKRLEDLTLEHWDRTIRTNLYGYFHMVKAAVPHLQQGSAIINTGSVTGLTGNKELVDYATTKGGIHAFTKSLSEMLLERGIRVNAVAPGPVWTPLNPADASADEVATFGETSPMHRPAQPEELSPAYVFLASPVCSSYITGEILPVLGGYMSR